MTVDLSSFPILCRPALPKDKRDVLELTKTIWDGGDYIPSVWDEWLAEPEGILIVAECGGKVAGLAKLTRFAPGDWFMEGLRVDPEFRERRIASRMNDFQLDYWRKHGEGSVRLATGSYNVKVHHMAERNGFRRVLEFIPNVAPALQDEVGNFELVASNELPAVMEVVRKSATFQLGHGLVDLGWRWANLNQKYLQNAVEDGFLWWWRDRSGVLAYWLDDEDEERLPRLLLVACPIDQLADLLMDYRRLAARMGKKRVGWTAPVDPHVEPALQTAGFSRSWDLSLYIFELVK